MTLTSKASPPLVALQTIDWPCSPFRSVGQSELSVPSWLLICSSTLSSVATLPHAVRAATAANAAASTAANRPKLLDHVGTRLLDGVVDLTAVHGGGRHGPGRHTVRAGQCAPHRRTDLRRQVARAARGTRGHSGLLELLRHRPFEHVLRHRARLGVHVVGDGVTVHRRDPRDRVDRLAVDGERAPHRLPDLGPQAARAAQVVGLHAVALELRAQCRDEVGVVELGHPAQPPRAPARRRAATARRSDRPSPSAIASPRSIRPPSPPHRRRADHRYRRSDACYAIAPTTLGRR